MALTFQQFDNAFTKVIQQNFENGNEQGIANGYFSNFVSVGDTTIGQEQFTSTEGVDLPSYVAERENLPEVDLWKGYKVVFQGNGVGSRCIITKEARVQANDDLTNLEAHIANKLSGSINSMLQFIEIDWHRFLNQGFTNAPVFANGKAIALASPDGEALFSNNHAYVSGETFDNLLLPAVLDLSVIDEVEKRGWAFLDAKGNPMPLNYNKIVVKKGGKAAQAAKRIFGYFENYSQYRANDDTNNINIYSTGQWTIVETPYLLSDTAYYFQADEAMSSVENPLFFHFQQRPRMEGLEQEANNLDRTYPYYTHYKFGIRNIPIGRLGSVGA